MWIHVASRVRLHFFRDSLHEVTLPESNLQLLFGCIHAANKNNSVSINWYSALEALLKCVFSFFNAKNRQKGLSIPRCLVHHHVGEQLKYNFGLDHFTLLTNHKVKKLDIGQILLSWSIRTQKRTRHTVNDQIIAHFQINASYLINAPSTLFKLY